MAEASLSEFLKQAWETIEPAVPLEWGWYLDAICLHLEAVRAGAIRSLYCGVPPGCLKSVTLNVAFVAWWWTTEPSIRFLAATSSDDNGTRDSLACRNLIESDWYQERWGGRFRLSGDQNVKTYYNNTCRGRRQTTTTGSKSTGKKCDVQLLDDIHDINDVESKVKREGVKYWHDKAFHNRVNSYKTARRVAIGQRTHYEDIYADFIQRGYECLILPEEFDPARRCTTSIGWSDPRTYEGEWLRESRFGPKQKAEAMKTLGSRGYATQHQQLPGPAEGNHFKRDWFKQRYFDGGDFIRMPSGKVWFKKQLTLIAVVDPAGGKSASADRTAIGVFALTPENDLLVLYMFCERIGVSEIVPKLKEICDAWDTDTGAVDYVIFEAEFLYNQYAEDAQKTAGMPPVRRQSTEGKDKLTRALPSIIRAEAGQVLFPASGPSYEWVDDCIDEMLAFTGDDDPHDDRVDCCPAGTLIRVREGVKPIEAIRVGDCVLTHYGRYRRVTAAWSRVASGLYEIRATGRPDLRLTANHRLLVCDSHRVRIDGKKSHNNLQWLGSEWRSVRDGLVVGKDGTCSIWEKEEADVEQIDLSPYATGYVERNDKLVATTYQGKRDNPKAHAIKRFLPIDNEAAMILGYFAAEGFCGRHQLGFASSTKEEPLHRLVSRWAERQGLTVSVRIVRGGFESRIGCVPLRNFFAEFGSCQFRAFPPWVMRLPDEKLQAVLVGYLLGDGHYGKTGVRSNTISPALGTQIHEIGMRLGLAPTLKRYSKAAGKDQWHVHFSRAQSEQIVAWTPDYLLEGKVVRWEGGYASTDQTCVKRLDSYLVGSIRSIVEIPGAVTVYNMAVEEDESYVANGTVVHNCIAWAAREAQEGDGRVGVEGVFVSGVRNRR